MAEIFGRNALERRLKTELQTEDVYYNSYDTLGIREAFSDHQARRLGEILTEGNYQVRSLDIWELSGLTARGDYQTFLDFIQNDSDLRIIHIAFEKVRCNTRHPTAPADEVTRRFFGAMSRSNSIQRLYIPDAHHLPTRTEILLDLLRTTTSISELGLFHSYGDPCQHPWGDAHEIETAFAQNTTIKKLLVQWLPPTDFASILQAMRRNLNIDHLVIYDTKENTYVKLAQELPFFKGLKRLQCRKWPDALNAMMMTKW